jgi:regulator of protease activity HflC (stomatin/prohibitin superfamily)
MDIKQKTAVISTLLNLILTILKFVLAGFSGSLVILAEAWHSLTDVVTSLLVYLAVSPRPQKSGEKISGNSETEKNGLKTGEGIDWDNITIENWMSLLIGGIILFAAIAVIYKILYTSPQLITSPFAYGLFFIFFAGCSLVVSIFEIKMGKKYDSPALIADGLHSKSDMIGSLIAGFTMIALQLGIDQLGINIDKIGAVIIIVFILSFSLETFVNFWSALHGKTGWRDRIATGLIAAAAERHTWELLFQRISHSLNWDHLSIELRSRIRRIFISLLALGVFLVIFFNCLTIIGPSQQGIRERLGRLVNPGDPLEPGLHLKLPWPLEKITKVDTRTIRSMNIGNISNPSAVALLWTKQHGTEESFLSAENYLFYPYIKLHYRIKDIFDYTYNFASYTKKDKTFSYAEDLLNNVSHRLLTEIFSTKIFTDIVTVYRGPMEERIREVVQAKLDELKSGLEIINVNTKDIHPPISVAASYEEVIAAMQEKEQKINQATGYSNSAIPEARGWAVKTKKQAESYVLEKKENARGEASRFLNRVEAIEAYPAITMPMLYREAIKENLANKPIILVEPGASVPDVWLKSGRPIFLENQF